MSESIVVELKKTVKHLQSAASDEVGLLSVLNTVNCPTTNHSIWCE